MRSNDGGQGFQLKADTHSNEVVTAQQSLWQNTSVKRIIGSIRRECLDHIVIFDQYHLRHTYAPNNSRHATANCVDHAEKQT